jgi:NAD(P)-dependent dehydrogenase (short-subunit alcohol dehydrogenase family)
LATLVEQSRRDGLRAEALVMDVSDIVATAASVAANGRFDILVNSAGLAIHSPALETDEDDYDTVQTSTSKVPVS